MNSYTQHYIELLWGLTEKELRTRYKYTIFGFFWLVLNPIIQMVTIGFIFTFFVKESVEHYYYYLFIGLLFWNFFSTSLTKGAPVIVNERTLIKKAVFPRSVIPLSIILSNFIHFLIALILYTIPVLFLHTLSIDTIPYCLFAFVLLIVFTTGITLLTSALNVQFRDTVFFVQALLNVWFYATPIVYSLGQIPPRMFWLWRLNPLTSIIQLFQHAFLGLPPPGPAMLSANISVIVIVTIIGIKVFISLSKTFDDWL